MKNNPLLIVLGEPNSIFSEILFKSYKKKIIQNFKRPIVIIGESALNGDKGKYIFESFKKYLNENNFINDEWNALNVLSQHASRVGSIDLGLFTINDRDNFIILDFGTATTFDVVIKQNYTGGIIAPGVKISLDTLSDKASLIPQINLKKITNVIGSNTISAVRSGFFWGYAGLIDNIVNLIKKETGKSFRLVITGGFSDLFKNSIKTKFIQNKNITLKGLIKIAKIIK